MTNRKSLIRAYSEVIQPPVLLDCKADQPITSPPSSAGEQGAARIARGNTDALFRSIDAVLSSNTLGKLHSFVNDVRICRLNEMKTEI
jgi:hypothetical protein